MDEPAHYQIRVAEHLDERWTKWFGGLEIGHDESGETTLDGEMADQPALFGVLGKVRDLGLTLISVQRLAPPGSAAGQHPAKTGSTSSGPEIPKGALPQGYSCAGGKSNYP